MSEQDGQTTNIDEPTQEKFCRNCGMMLVGEFCHGCGQHGPRSGRLNTREVLRDFSERLFSLESSFLKTLVGLTLRPGTVCSEYVEGKRKRYTNPFAYFLLAATVDVFLTGMGSSATTVPSEDEPPEFLLKHFTKIILLFLIPLALVWSKLFRRTQRNLAENYVFSLYTFGQFLWSEVLILGPLAALIPSEMVMGVIYLFAIAGYFVFAGTVFYQEKAHVVFAKYLLSFVIIILVAAIVRLLLLPVWPDDV